MTDATPLLPRISTGDSALDEILGGGIPTRSFTILAGTPGAGKTVLALQLVFRAAREGKRCLYFTTLSEPAMKLMRYMQGFSFFEAALTEKYLKIIDLGTALREGPEHTLELLSERVAQEEPELVVVDSFRALADLLRSPTVGRPLVYDLAVQMASWGATSLLVGEYTEDDYTSLAEFAIADGVIRLGVQHHELMAVREMEVQKMRGVGFVGGRHFFEIDHDGMHFYPRVRSPDERKEPGLASADERISTGVTGLDRLLAGGLPRTSCTLVQGGTGTGKTLLTLQFLLEGARQGEKGIFFTLEETPDQLRQVAYTLGWDLAAVEAQGLLTIQYTSPVELSPDLFLHRARHQVEAIGAKRAVFDSLSTMSLSLASERRFKQLVYAITKHLRRMGTTVMVTLETSELLGSAVLSSQNVSFISDNILQLRYLENEQHLERAISVLKARGVKHLTDLQRLIIDHGGVRTEPTALRLSPISTARPRGEP